MRSIFVAFSCLLCGLVVVSVAGQDEEPEQTKAEALTLERIFPPRSFFGSGARSLSFSHDGRFCAFLYRPYDERRHGSDLYLYDSETGQSRRMTSAGRMSEFQETSREVVEDRTKKAKKAGHTPGSLALEQNERRGWTPDGPEGYWTGEATSPRRGVIAGGDCTLDLRADHSGDLVIGLVRLSVGKGTLEDGTFTAKVSDKELGVEGELTLSFDETLEGALVLEEPEATVRIKLSRAEREDDGDGGPAGVIGATGERLTLGDVVASDDARAYDEKDDDSEDGETKDDDRGERYRGISSIQWAPESHEMLVGSQGDVYRLTIDATLWDEWDEGDDEDSPLVAYRGELSRLTRTDENERGVQYLPDGSGYTFMRGGALIRVTFDDHKLLQLDPELEDGEQMSSYAISPDQKRVVFMARKGASSFAQGRQVTIVNYRDRFARATQVRRHMPDDPFPESYTSVYLYDLEGHETEEGTLKKVFSRRLSGPRDTMRVPNWSGDSSRVAFAAYDQASGHVKVMEAGFEDEEEEEDSTAEGAESAEEEGELGQEGEEEIEEAGEDGEGDGEEGEADFSIFDARVVYQFLHYGGPTTPGMVDPIYLPDSRRMAFITELSGFRQLHMLDPVYEQLTQLTEGQFEVYPFDLSEDHSTLYVTATKVDPNQEHPYAVNLETGEMTALASARGVFGSVAVSDDGQNVLSTYVDFGAPSELFSIEAEGEGMVAITDSHLEVAHELTTVTPEYFSYENRHGQTIHGHMFKPADWTADDKRPLLIYVYGGPLGERKMAHRGSYSGSSYYFARYMSEVHGWVTATIDPRGASGYGAVFEKASFEQVGKPQTEDLVDGANWLVEHAGVDEDKMSLHGWSFGGFQTQMVLYTEPDVFAAGIAGAGPTEWHNYNSWYSTGTIGANEKGKTSLDKYSLLPLAKNLKGKLLLIHGVEDSNVLYQDTMRVYRELLKAGKEVNVELFIDPTGRHGLGGDVKSVNRYRKYEDFLLRHLGEGEAAEGSEAEIEPEEENDDTI